MNKKLLTLPLLTIALVLTGCKTPSPSSSSSSQPDIPSQSSESSAASASESELPSESSESSESSASSEVTSSSEELPPLVGWPSEIIADYLASFGLDFPIPALDLESEVIVEYLNDGAYYLDFEYIRLRVENKNVIAEFSAALKSAGFDVQPPYEESVDEYYAYDASWGKLMVHYFYEDGDSIIIITALVDDSEQGPPPTNPDKNAVFDFLTWDQIVGGKNSEMTKWEADSSSFVVTKMENGIGVGNPSPGKEYYANPLRLYAGQTVAITAGESELIEQVKFDLQNFDGTKEIASTEALIAAAPSNVTYYVNGDSITYVFATPVPSFSFQIEPTDGVQARLYKATLYFV